MKQAVFLKWQYWDCLQPNRYTSLTKQYRMRPEIAELLKDIYPDLTTDQRSVRKGLGLMKESVFW